MSSTIKIIINCYFPTSLLSPPPQPSPKKTAKKKKNNGAPPGLRSQDTASIPGKAAIRVSCALGLSDSETSRRIPTKSGPPESPVFGGSKTRCNSPRGMGQMCGKFWWKNVSRVETVCVFVECMY